MTRYRIHWRALRTGATGHGTGTFTKSQAEGIAQQMNAKEYEEPIAARLLEYWVQEETP